MDENTPNLDLPYIHAAQAQKHVTHNEAIRTLDAIIQLSVLDRDLATPPISPLNGQRYIIAAGATGDWTGKEGQIAAWQDNSWMIHAPVEGWICWIGDEYQLAAFDGTSWSDVSSAGPSVNPTPLIGINTTASEPDKLSVESDAILFSHDDVTPGNGSVQHKLNKAAVDKTASIVFQDNWTGKAEIGLTGDDDLHFKVSPDGTSWHDSIIVDKTSGSVVMPNSPFVQNMLFNLLQDAGRFASSPEPQGSPIGAFSAPTYLNSYNGAVFSSHAKFIFDNSTHGGAAGPLNSDVDELAVRIKSAPWLARFGPEFWVMKIICGSGTSSSYVLNGTTRYYIMTNISVPLWSKSTWGINVKVLSGSMSIKHVPSSSDLYIDGFKQTGSSSLQNSDGWKQIVYVGTADQKDSYGYNNGLFAFHAEPSSTILTALPFIYPGQTIPRENDLFDRVPSLTVWR